MIQQYTIPFDEALIEDIYKLKKNNRGVKNSNVGGWHSQSFYNPPEWFKDYSDVISKTADKEIDYLWFNINGPGHSNRWHTHGNSHSLIGVWYLRTTDNSGNLLFKVDNQIKTIIPCSKLFITHSCGINHCVTENLTDQDRVSVAFNFK